MKNSEISSQNIISQDVSSPRYGTNRFDKFELSLFCPLIHFHHDNLSDPQINSKSHIISKLKKRGFKGYWFYPRTWQVILRNIIVSRIINRREEFFFQLFAVEKHILLCWRKIVFVAQIKKSNVYNRLILFL